MDFVNFKGATNLATPPKDWVDNGEVTCSILPMKVERLGPYIAKISYWRPTEQELAQLCAGACVKLSNLGPVTPVAIGVEHVEIIE